MYLATTEVEEPPEDDKLSEDECQSKASSSDPMTQSDSQASTSPTTYQSEITNLGSDISEFCGPSGHPPEPKLKTFKIVGDNIDKNIRPREMRVDNQTQSLHFFHSYAVRDRVDLSTFSSDVNVPDVSNIKLESLLPSPNDEHILKKNLAVLMGRVLIKHLPFFKTFGSGLERHIQHEYSVEMARKSEVVRYYSRASQKIMKYNNYRTEQKLSCPFGVPA